MRVLVTGATGFVGGGVVRALLADGHEVHGLVRDPGAASALQRDGIILHAGDMRQPATYAPLVGQVDAVVQAAQLSTAGRVTRARAAQVFAAEHTMTTALAGACLDQRRRLLYTGGLLRLGRSRRRVDRRGHPAVPVTRRGRLRHRPVQQIAQLPRPGTDPPPGDHR